MIRQQANDLLEILFEGNYYYVVVLTKTVMFGGNIVFIFHGDGSKKELGALLSSDQPSGFNWCSDLLLAKKQGEVVRMKKLDSVEKFWKTRYFKNPIGAHQWGDKVKGWLIYHVDDLRNPIAKKRWIYSKYKMAMDKSCSSFDIIAERSLEGFTPDKSPWLTWKISKEEKIKREKIYAGKYYKEN